MLKSLLYHSEILISIYHLMCETCKYFFTLKVSNCKERNFKNSCSHINPVTLYLPRNLLNNEVKLPKSLLCKMTYFLFTFQKYPTLRCPFS